MIQHDDRQWYAVYTRSRFERAVYSHLLSQGIESFLPEYRARRRWSDRTVCLELPLFPSYLFIRAALRSSEFYRVQDTRGVVSLVGGSCGPVPVADEEISAIKRVLDADVPVESVPWLQPGRAVRVVAGPLTGLEGSVEKQGRRGKLYIAIRTIGQTIAVEIDMADVAAA